MNLSKPSTRNVALVAIFAALYYVLSIVSPYVPALGVPDLKINLEALVATIFGIVVGPYLGFTSALLGAFVAWVLPPGSMNAYGLPFLLSPALNSLVTGLIYYRKWKQASVVLTTLILTFIILPPSQPLGEYWYIGFAVVWDKIIALSLIYPITRLAKQSLGSKSKSILYFLLAFIGNQADNMLGADMFAVPLVYNGIFGMDVSTVRFLFTVSPFIYPAIRLIQAFIATIIIVPLLPALKGSGWILEENTILD
jgi:ECF transporter S component (folate family)